MKLKKIGDGEWQTVKGGFKIRQATTLRPNAEGETEQVEIYHVYDKSGAYAAQVRDLESDLQRGIRDYRTRTERVKA